MSNDHDRRRDLSKLRTIPLDDATHRRLRLYAHGLHEPGEAGETIARVAGEAIGAWLDRQEGCVAPMRAVEVEDWWPGPPPPEAARDAEPAGDPSEGAGELYGRWRKP